MTKERTAIPPETAARVLVASDRTCCVCRDPDKSPQIHHIDDEPCNHDHDNLAVLCFDCHNKTLLRGGFDRKLNAPQVRLFRDEWHTLVRLRRDQLHEEPLRLTSQRGTAGSISRFSSRVICSHEGGRIHAVRGEILRAFEALAGPVGRLGFPVTDEMPATPSPKHFSSATRARS